MKEEILNKKITGFEFNINWLIAFSETLLLLGTIPQEKLKPLYMLYSDCMELAREQGVDLIKMAAEMESDTSE